MAWCRKRYYSVLTLLFLLSFFLNSVLFFKLLVWLSVIFSAKYEVKFQLAQMTEFCCKWNDDESLKGLFVCFLKSFLVFWFMSCSLWCQSEKIEFGLEMATGFHLQWHCSSFFLKLICDGKYEKSNGYLLVNYSILCYWTRIFLLFEMISGFMKR